MKKFLAFVLGICCLTTTIHSQTPDVIRNPSLGINFTFADFATATAIRTKSLSAAVRDKQFARFKNMVPGISLGYATGLTRLLDFSAAVGVNDNFAEGDASVNFKLLPENYHVIPYASAGIGANVSDSKFGSFIPLGIGLRINISKEVGFNFASQYRVPTSFEGDNYHFFYSFGVYATVAHRKEEVKPVPVVEKPKDTDGDGITDDVDKCPTVPGVAKYDGCPVPDTDKDGINDDEDKCPTVPGVARYQGCPVPDTDKDGINDEEDKCPTVAGVARYQGCPVPDTDGDGVNDEEDKCPNVPGVPENQGCPAIKEEVKKKVDYAADNILFAINSSVLLAHSNKGLNDVVKILQDDPTLKLTVDGYTDNTGTPVKNQVLSEKRANAVKAYMVKKGIDESRLTATGHGQDSPVADNKTAAGRKKNRRVELKLGY